MENSPLFSSNRLSDHLENLTRDIRTTISNYSGPDLEDGTFVDRISQLVKSATITVPVLDESKIEAQNKEADMEVQTFSGQTKMVKGTRITIIVPFTGNADLFHLTPSEYNLNPPAANIKGQELQLVYLLNPSENISKVKQLYPSALNSIRWYLERVSNDLSVHNNSLAQTINSAVENRIQQVKRSKGMMDELGLKIRP